ncbi:MAG: MerR family transcriptional regulator [Candidatus Omnitrophota bacterium]
MRADKKMTITEVAEEIGVVPKTIQRWEKSGKVKRAKRDWRNWRIYTYKEVEQLKYFRNNVY